jgi:hypothetical protein
MLRHIRLSSLLSLNLAESARERLFRGSHQLQQRLYDHNASTIEAAAAGSLPVAPPDVGASGSTADAHIAELKDSGQQRKAQKGTFRPMVKQVEALALQGV